MKLDFKALKKTLKSRKFAKARKVIVGIVGSVVVVAGIALIFLPGPAFIVIPAGFGILALEFEWAHRWAHKFREWMHVLSPKNLWKRWKKA